MADDINVKFTVDTASATSAVQQFRQQLEQIGTATRGGATTATSAVTQLAGSVESAMQRGHSATESLTESFRVMPGFVIRAHESLGVLRGGLEALGAYEAVKGIAEFVAHMAELGEHAVIAAAAVGTTAEQFSELSVVMKLAGGDADKHGNNPLATLPPRSSVSGRISWQPTSDFTLSSSFQQTSYPGTPRVGFASLSASYRIGDVSTFINLSRSTGLRSSTTIVVGVSFTFGGDIQASASGGYGTGTAPDGRVSGGFSASQPLRESPGDIGWQASAQKQPGGVYADAAAEIRTGYGIPGVEVNSFAGQTTGYVKARGSVGLVDLHPFVGDPVTGGPILADGGAPGMPVQLNGYDKGKTSFDGKLLIPDAIPGAPQRIAIDTARLPLDLIPSDTDKSVVVRRGGAAIAGFDAQTASTSAIVLVTIDGKPPPIGSSLVSATSSAPIDRKGQAYLPSLAPDEVLTVELAEGGSCKVHTKFDGQGAVNRRIGPFPCVGAPP